MSSHWDTFHQKYAEPEGRHAQRLALVQAALSDVLDAAPPGPIHVLDVCAGEGRGVLPVLTTHPRRADVRACLVDSNSKVCAVARAFAADHGLDGVVVVEGDAGSSSRYLGRARADVVVLSGVLTHLSRRDIRRTIRSLPQVCAAGAAVIWTLGKHHAIDEVRKTFDHAGFRQITLRGHADRNVADHVGVERMETAPQPLRPSVRWFRFTTDSGWLRTLIRRVARGLAEWIRDR